MALFDKAPREPDFTPPVERQPYGGFLIDSAGKASGLAPTGPHLLVLAGTGAGKSRRVLAPQIMMWDGPVCAVSAKSDLAEMTARTRAQRGGPIYVMDLTGQADWTQLPDGVTPVANDPCALLTPDADGSTDDSALDLATLLTQVGSLGMGGGQTGGDSAFWMTLALGTLACLIQAGGWYPDYSQDPDNPPMVWGGGIDWVLKAALVPDAADDGDDETVDLTTPSWTVAATRASLLGSSHAADVASVQSLDPKQRDSVGINLRVALSSWKKRAVRGRPGQVAFTPQLLEDPRATFYLVSPSSGSAAGAATSVIESLVEHWKIHAIPRGLPKIAMVIDECPQICPIPRLSEHIGLMRSYGMHFTVAAQHTSQFEKRFGKVEVDVLRNVFPAILIGIGAIERDIVETAAWTQPPSERPAGSTDASGRQQSLSTERGEVLHAAELLPRHQGEGRLLIRGLAGMKVKLGDFTKMVR
ncbi:type IV secretory system conjugative DNA transfer family protein [Leucobacter massiliensis]|uniref:TraD/TraG TraM recognition site domain-containing protein n=1 Tax=Leucobacter massiliensis TaxID=1686285 RepID=A0A2S9QLQ9_9MICO|nr:type IV secretory system conjugative DNA transfer family protein [Leucobacter massiliensis]PRI10515.1 hypothetical protein B4915_10945 [Leucobacter massiliensis]